MFVCPIFFVVFCVFLGQPTFNTTSDTQLPFLCQPTGTKPIHQQEQLAITSAKKEAFRAQAPDEGRMKDPSQDEGSIPGWREKPSCCETWVPWGMGIMEKTLHVMMLNFKDTWLVRVVMSKCRNWLGSELASYPYPAIPWTLIKWSHQVWRVFWLIPKLCVFFFVNPQVEWQYKEMVSTSRYAFTKDRKMVPIDRYHLHSWTSTAAVKAQKASKNICQLHFLP